MSVGYNGCVSGLTNCFQGGCPRCNNNSAQGVDLHKCYCLHAEESAIIECGLQNTKDSAIYVTLFPCLMCSKIIVHAVVALQQGIKEVFYAEEYAAENTEQSLVILTKCGITISKVDPKLLNVLRRNPDDLAARLRAAQPSQV